MKRMICLLLSMSLMSAAAFAGDEKAGELTDPVEILKKVDAAAKAVKAVKYDASVEATGALTARVPKMEASFIVSGYANGTYEKCIVHAKVTPQGATEARKVSCGTDSDVSFAVDHQGKKAYEDIDPAVMGPCAGIVQRAGMIEFVHTAPFNDEINGQSQELRGSEKIGGEDCYVIHVVYATAQAPEGTWSFSKKDFLPRRRVDTYTLPGGETGTVVKTITNLVVDPKIDENAFKLKLPEGYTKTDDFAPNFLAQPQ